MSSQQQTFIFDQIFKKGASKRPIKVGSISVGPSRKSDPETSKLAADANKSERDIQRTRVLEYLKSAGASGATDYEISVGIGALRTSAGKRRKELESAGLVCNTGMKRKTDTGASAIVWAIK